MLYIIRIPLYKSTKLYKQTCYIIESAIYCWNRLKWKKEVDERYFVRSVSQFINRASFGSVYSKISDPDA